MERCDRRNCNEPATARIPLPVGLSQTQILVCLRHEAVARNACYYVQGLDQGEDAGEAEFRTRILNKHVALRGTEDLLYQPRHRLVKGSRWVR